MAYKFAKMMSFWFI